MRTATAAIVFSLLTPVFTDAQGSLIPPGAPAPMMKSLDQLEARTPLVADNPGVEVGTNGGIAVTAPGSYYLTGNLTVTSGDGLIIAASNVSVDLNGFTISSTSATPEGFGVLVADGLSQISIRNGFIRGGMTFSEDTFVPGPGFDTGVSALNAALVAVSDLSIDGVSANAIDAGENTVRHCTVHCCGGTGIQALLTVDSVASRCGGTAIFAGTAENCLGVSIGGIGIHATFAVNCYGYSTDGTGLYSSTATNCSGTSKSQTGLFAGRANNCNGLSETGQGLVADVAANCTGTSASGIGLRAIKTATGCSGQTASGSHGLYAGGGTTARGTGSAVNCRGEATGASASSSVGLYAGAADNCTGISAAGIGLSAKTATNCFGSTTNGSYGISVDGAANNCRANNGSGAQAIALKAAIAVACTAEAGIIESPSKQLGTP